MSTRVRLLLLLSVAVVLALLVGFASLAVKFTYELRAPAAYGAEEPDQELPSRAAWSTTESFQAVPLLGLVSIWMLATLVCAILAAILIVALKVYEKKGPPAPSL